MDEAVAEMDEMECWFPMSKSQEWSEFSFQFHLTLVY